MSQAVVEQLFHSFGLNFGSRENFVFLLSERVLLSCECEGGRLSIGLLHGSFEVILERVDDCLDVGVLDVRIFPMVLFVVRQAFAAGVDSTTCAITRGRNGNSLSAKGAATHPPAQELTCRVTFSAVGFVFTPPVLLTHIGDVAETAPQPLPKTPLVCPPPIANCPSTPS